MPSEEVKRYSDQAREFYNRRGRRADGQPLKLGDVDEFVSPETPRGTQVAGCAPPVLLAMSWILFELLT